METCTLPPPAEPAAHDALAQAVAAVRAATGVDLSRHRRPTLERRLAGRLAQSGARSMAEYLGRLARDPAEPEALLAQLTIKVSHFFRDPALHAALEREVLPWLAGRDAPARVWSAGCARGEEPYSLAMTLAAARGPQGVEVLATDVDAAALAAGHRAAYPSAELAHVPPPLRGRFTEGAGPGFRVAAPLAARVSFARHDLASGERVAATPFDVVACRNVLIYFDAPLKEAALDLLLAHLAPGGYLCLGHAEWPTPRAAARLAVVDRRARLFRKETDR